MIRVTEPWESAGTPEDPLYAAHCSYYPQVLELAKEAFARANEARVAYSVARSDPRRHLMIERALLWREILRYMESRGMNRFYVTGYLEWQWKASSRTGRVARWARKRRFYRGSKPVNWR